MVRLLSAPGDRSSRRFFHHTGTIHLRTCEMEVLPIDWSTILGIRFGGRIPPSDPVPDFEALEILGIADPAAVVGKNLPSLRISYLKDLLRREIEEPPTELRYRQWTAYFIFSCFLGNDKSTIPTPIVGMFRDIDALRDYDWGALTYGFYIPGLAPLLPSTDRQLPATPDSVFPLARRWDSAWIQRLTVRTLMECHTTVDCIRDIDIVFQPYSSFLVERPEVFRAMELSHLRIWIRSPRSWELLIGERTLRQLGGEAFVPVDPPRLMTIKDYIPRAPSDSCVEGVEAYPDLIQVDVPYQEWFERVSLGSLMSLHEVEGGPVMGGMAMDSHVFQSFGEVDWLQSEILCLQLELSADLVQRQRDLDSRDAKLAIRAATIRRLEEQLQGVGIPPVTGVGSFGIGQTSSPPPTDPVSRDWFFDDPPSL
uniref:Aminotransferase-like plant mobile domain-containing protein n=1 Tax=Fagus sylvatica TaxID=28930 RepID=A0A2N9H8U4_FAGSY